jgi:hypothetical protein
MMSHKSAKRFSPNPPASSFHYIWKFEKHDALRKTIQIQHRIAGNIHLRLLNISLEAPGYFWMSGSEIAKVVSKSYLNDNL